MQIIANQPEFPFKPTYVRTYSNDNIQDKEAVLRKAKLLRGSNILITEDFPRRVREHRAELARFAKEVRKLALCCVS